MQLLQHIAAVQVAAALWSQHNVMISIREFCSEFLSDENSLEVKKRKWYVIEESVKEGVQELPAPECIKKILIGIINPVGLQIKNWIENHWKKHCFGIELPNKLCWTPLGTVHCKNTVRVIIKDKSIHIATRYRLACIYCIADAIPKLWEKMPEISRETIYCNEDPMKIENFLVSFWTYAINGKIFILSQMINILASNPCSPYEYVFEYAAYSGNKPACEYFLKKLSLGEKKLSLVRIVHSIIKSKLTYSSNLIDFAEVLHLLLSEMDNEQKTELFKRRGSLYYLLECYFEWPWQDFFLEISNHLGYYCHEWFECFLHYDSIFRKIVHKIKEGCNDYDYQELFVKFWERMPDDYKDKFIEISCERGPLLSDLFKMKDEKNIKRILKYASCSQKIDLLFGLKGQEICKNLIFDGQWNLLEIFMQECSPSRGDILKFKDILEKYIMVYSRKGPNNEIRLTRDKIHEFFSWIDSFVSRLKKRKYKDKSNSVKKLCNTEIIL